ncbi:carbohydrate ABC transporter permease [Arenivirga flava]|uniref:ABC transporter permease n=1 Tax=Arenivirga flava TaxID=1930060 RepID=A0AA37XAF1_9MICO|nr:sugar ABC transporter permease [Arenivirga flava]GMA29834.1 ABC transporter permease [Arenivirga flava]
MKQRMLETEIDDDLSAAPSAPLDQLPVKLPPPRRRRRSLVALVFLLPWLIGMIGITLGPMIASLLLSFTDYNFLRAPEWVGIDNYARIFADDPRFLTSLGVTFTYVVVSVPLQLAFALGIAVLLNQGLRGLAFYRSVYYLPSLLGTSVAIAILWRQIFGADGLFNQLLGLAGFEDLPNWIATPELALGTLITLNVWTFGSPMVIFLAGLRQVPSELYEAAAVDGAGRWTRFARITIPMISPVIFFNLILQMIGAFQTFTQAYIVSGGSGGPVDSTLFYTLYLYQKAFRDFDMGYASAMAWILLLIIALFTWLAFATSNRWVHYGED